MVALRLARRLQTFVSMEALRIPLLSLALAGSFAIACGSTDGTMASPPDESPPARSETPQPSFGAGGELHLVRLMHAMPDAGGGGAGAANAVDAATAPGSGGAGGGGSGGSADASSGGGGSAGDDAGASSDDDAAAGGGSQEDSGCDPGGAQDESRHHHHGH